MLDVMPVAVKQNIKLVWFKRDKGVYLGFSSDFAEANSISDTGIAANGNYSPMCTIVYSGRGIWCVLVLGSHGYYSWQPESDVRYFTDIIEAYCAPYYNPQRGSFCTLAAAKRAIEKFCTIN